MHFTPLADWFGQPQARDLSINRHGNTPPQSWTVTQARLDAGVLQLQIVDDLPDRGPVDRYSLLASREILQKRRNPDYNHADVLFLMG